MIGLLPLLAACSAPATEVSATVTPRLTPYRTPTRTPRPSLLSPTVEPIPSLGPSATPLTHVVAEHETLIGIAIRYGITLDELLAANPGVNPRLLSIGQGLIIPGPGGELTQALAPTPTPMPLSYSPVTCYRTLSDGLWCLTTVRNPTDMPVEGVAVLVTLLDRLGRPLATQAAEAPLSLLAPGQIMPLAAYFSPPAPEAADAVAQATGAVGGGDTAGRYLPITLAREQHEPGIDGRSWRVLGAVGLAADAQADAVRARVVLVAMDEHNQALGFITWDFTGALAPGTEAPFDLTVFSLGPAIDHVEILAEAQPAP